MINENVLSCRNSEHYTYAIRRFSDVFRSSGIAFGNYISPGLEAEMLSRQRTGS